MLAANVSLHGLLPAIMQSLCVGRVAASYTSSSGLQSMLVGGQQPFGGCQAPPCLPRCRFFMFLLWLVNIAVKADNPNEPVRLKS